MKNKSYTKNWEQQYTRAVKVMKNSIFIEKCEKYIMTCHDCGWKLSIHWVINHVGGFPTKIMLSHTTSFYFSKWRSLWEFVNKKTVAAEIIIFPLWICWFPFVLGKMITIISVPWWIKKIMCIWCIKFKEKEIMRDDLTTVKLAVHLKSMRPDDI